MAEQIQELINKIKNEGIDAANQKAKEIEDVANAQAKVIIDDAKKAAEEMITKAKEDIGKMQASSETAIKQASRDTLISLRKAINDTLNGIIGQEVKGALSKDKISVILSDVIKKYVEQASDVSQVKITLSDEDAAALKDDLVSNLQKEVKGSITIEGAEDIEKGFTISFDGGKSSFDFSDKSLVEYIGGLVNPQVASLIKSSVK